MTWITMKSGAAGSGGRSGRGRAPGLPAFTLMEMMLAVAVVALIAVGLAAVFGSIGDTVTAGRRVSEFNARAAQMEHQFRADFDRMTRDGFLVIRNQYATDTNGTIIEDVQRFPGDSQKRRRRIDEILFFARGRFTSAREPPDPRLVATSDAARIYYGHGVLLPDDDPAYTRPRVDDADLGELPGLIGGPNEYAGDWALVRHVTLLNPLSTALQKFPDPPPFGLDPRFAQDNEIRVSLQPAATYVFRSLAKELPDRLAITPGGGPALDWPRPAFESGIVDIATNDLTEIQQLVLAVGDPNGALGVFTPDRLRRDSDLRDMLGGTTDLGGRFARANANDLGDPVLGAMRAWMLNAFPANSAGQFGRARSRIRSEPAPTDFFGTLARTDRQDLKQLYALADQRMLSASRFLPNCTEFIVEWSFGQVDTRAGAPTEGQIIWHGMDRIVGQDAGGNDIYAARPYPLLPDATGQAIPVRPGTTYVTQSGKEMLWATASGLISGDQPIQSPSDSDYEAFFGYVDPSFPPNPLPIDPPAQDTVPWNWPTLIRVTVTLADPGDPSFEKTYQFVFETPAGASS